MENNILTELFANKATFAGDDIIPIPGVKFNKAEFLAIIDKYKSNKDAEKKDEELIS